MLGHRLPPWATAAVVLLVTAYVLITGWFVVRRIQDLAGPAPRSAIDRQLPRGQETSRTDEGSGQMYASRVR
jgi:hypothetical protein